MIVFTNKDWLARWNHIYVISILLAKQCHGSFVFFVDLLIFSAFVLHVYHSILQTRESMSISLNFIFCSIEVILIVEGILTVAVDEIFYLGHL